MPPGPTPGALQRVRERAGWQTGDPYPTRSAVDVAAVADPQGGLVLQHGGGGWLVAGGTSVGPARRRGLRALGQPRWAGLLVRPQGAFHPVGSAFQSGLGSPQGVAGL
jgi:hypothetical protein